MGLEDVFKLLIYCVDCNQPVGRFDISEIEYGQFITCPNCKSRFNLWGLYLNFYENIPLAKRIADSIANAVWGNGYTVKEGKTTDLKRLDAFLNDNNFGSLLKQVVFDTTVFGVSFLEKTQSAHVLRRIDPASAEAKVGPTREPGGGAFFLQVQEVVKHQADDSRQPDCPSD